MMMLIVLTTTCGTGGGPKDHDSSAGTAGERRCSVFCGF
jgi:hypothetical protein